VSIYRLPGLGWDFGSAHRKPMRRQSWWGALAARRISATFLGETSRLTGSLVVFVVVSVGVTGDWQLDGPQRITGGNEQRLSIRTTKREVGRLRLLVVRHAKFDRHEFGTLG
jgi:hypothetical protein